FAHSPMKTRSSIASRGMAIGQVLSARSPQLHRAQTAIGSAHESSSRIDAQHAEFHGRFDVEEVDVFGPEPVEQSGRLLRSHSDKHLDGLIRKLKEMRRVDSTAAAETFPA